MKKETFHTNQMMLIYCYKLLINAKKILFGLTVLIITYVKKELESSYKWSILNCQNYVVHLNPTYCISAVIQLAFDKWLWR